MKTGIVFDIKEFAVFDGPGIRTTVFMKGCPLRCQWCHNPEGLSPKPELMVSKAACRHCGSCTDVCDHPDSCIACGKCIPYCRDGLRRICGVSWDAPDLARRLLKDRDVYASSGGGVTFSGGEPLLQWDFVSAVIAHMPGVHTALETSAYAPDHVFQEALNQCSLILMDWKISDPELHKRYTGVDQSPILRHLKELAQSNTPFYLRLPVIPGVNDNLIHFETAAQLIENAKNLCRVDILPYQRAAGAKYEMVGRAYAPDFHEDKPLEIFTDPFEKRNIPYQIFK